MNGFYPEGEEPAVTGGPEFEVPARGIVVLISKEAPKPARKPKKAGKKKAEKAEKAEKTEIAEKTEKQADGAEKSEVKAEHQVDEITSNGT